MAANQDPSPRKPTGKQGRGGERPAPPQAAGPSRRPLAIVLVVLASVCAYLATLAIWVERQALDTGTWTETSSELLERPVIRDAVATFLVDQLYASIDIEAELRALLPEGAEGLAAPAAGGLRELADRGANEALRRPRIQALWADTNRAAHTQLLAVLEGDEIGAVGTEEGSVTLDLRGLLGQIAEQIGIGAEIEERIPEDVGQIEILRDEDLETAQDAVVVLRGSAAVFVILAFALAAAATATAADWRRETVRSLGIGLVAVGTAVLLTRSLAGNIVVGELAETAAVKPAAEATWEISTSLLNGFGVALLVYGVLIVFGAWTVGGGALATELRGRLAPFLHEERIAIGGAAAIVILILLWSPVQATSGPLAAAILAVLVAVEVQFLRRRTIHEHPDARLDLDFSEDIAGRGQRLGVAFDRMRKRAQRAMRGGRDPETDARLESLERLTKLHESGALTQAEFRREKKRILGE